MLYSFNTLTQQYGDFFAGYPWTIVGCGTFRNSVSAHGARNRMKRYIRRLGLSIDAWIPYIAVPEHRESGCGLDSIRLHFHFLAACPPQWESSFPAIASELWAKELGNAHIKPYNPSLPAAHYIAKLAGRQNFDFILDNLDRLRYLGQSDLLQATHQNPYVPKHAKGRSRLKTLVVRDVITGLPKGE